MNRARLPLTLGLLLFAVGGCNQRSGGQPQDDATRPATSIGESHGEESTPTAPGADVAVLEAVSGPSGIQAADLPEGTFLGKGAKLHAGQALTIPEGTLAEVALNGGGTLRFNADTELVLPSDGSRRVELVRGEAVAIVAAGQAPILLASGDDVLSVNQGEARAFSRDGAHDYAVVYGDSSLSSAGQTVDLGAGATLRTPLPPAEPAKPIVSLRPLEETAWARSFDLAAQMTDAVPVGVGALTARRAGESVERYSLDLVDQRVNVTISGRIALTEIEQTFFNEAPAVLEGTYRFPIPADATISGLSLLIGNTWEDAAMLEKQRARRIFKEIVDATVPRDPALLEWEQGNIFKLKIFPIPGRGARKIRLRYTQVLPAVGDNLRYRYPLSGSSSGASGTAIGNFAMSIQVDRDGLPADAMETMRTPMANLDRRELADRIELTTEKRDFRPVHDLGVDIPLPPAERRMHAETHLDKDGQAYFMVAVEPDLPLGPDTRPSRYVFVLDRSHSTTPELWTAARSLVGAMSSALADEDRLTVLACDTACDVAPGGLHPPTADDLATLDTFLAGQTLAGASDIGGMMRAAAETMRTATGPEPGEQVIVYLGDGNASAGELAPDELLRHLEPTLDGIRVQSVAMGARSDLMLLGALADNTGGDLVQADAKDDLQGLVRELRLRAAVPVARNVEIDLPPGMVYTHPSKVGSIRSGDPLVLVGKLGGPVDGDMTIRATGPGGEVISDTFHVKLAADREDPSGRHSHLPRTWAAEEIEMLTTTEGFSAKKTIIDLSKRYTVLSRYTALLVLENDAMYREFNVVRNAGQTDEWRGALGKKAGASADSSVAEKAKPAPAPSRDAPAGPPADAGLVATKSAPTSAPQAKESKSDAKDNAAGFEPIPLEEAERTMEEDREEMPEGEPVELLDDDFDAPAQQSAPTSPKKKTKAKSSRRPPSMSKPQVALDDPFAGGDVALGGGIASGGGGYGRGKIARRPQLRIADQVAPSADVRAKIDNLRNRRDADPSSRKDHRRLVQAAIYYGVPEAFDYARAWAEADPDHAPALLAVADLLAARGEPVAHRAYASAIEVRPFDRKLQRRIADGLLSKGETARACAHLRAIVSIDPAKAQHHADLARCLGAIGRWDDAQAAIVDGRGRAKGNQKPLSRAADEVMGRVVQPLAPDTLHSYPDLKATLTWSGPSDLDIAVVDHRGRRLSALRREVVRVREREGEETLTLATIGKPVYIEVSRRGEERAAGGSPAKAPPTRATLRIKTPDGSRSFDITSDHTTLRLAKVSWRR